MAHELIDAVTVYPEGPVTVGLGNTLDITASYTLNGPPVGSPTASSYSLAWQKVSPGAPTSWDTEDPAAAATDYTKTCPTSVLSAVGTYVLRVSALYINDVPFQDTVDVDITVHVVPWRELEALDTTHTEGQATPTTVTEGAATPTTVTEGQATATTVTEGAATPTTVTEGT